MKIDLTNDENLRILCKYTGPLAERRFEREELLRSIHLSAFEPELELINTVCTEDEIAYYKEIEIYHAKKGACGRGYMAPLADDCKRLRLGMPVSGDERYLEKLRLINRCSDKIDSVKQAAPWPAQSAYSQKRRQLRQQEIAAYAPTLYQSVKNPDDRQSHYTLYCQAVAAYGAEHGFTLDKAMSTRAIHIYSKPLYKDYVIAIDVDKKHLVNALGKHVFVYGAPEKRLGDLGMSFQLTHRDNKLLKDFRQAKGAGPLPYFPLGVGYNDTNFYSLANSNS